MRTVSWSSSYPNLSYIGDIVAEAGGGYSITGTNTANEVVWIKNDVNNNEISHQILSFNGQVKALIKTGDEGYVFGTAEGVYKTDRQGHVQWSQSITDLEQVITTSDGGIAAIVQGKLLKFNEGGSTPIPSPRLQLDDTEYSVNIGQPIDLVVTYQTGNQFTNVTTSSSYSTSNPAIAIVDQEGNIIGLQRGRTTLTVAYNGVHTTATIDVY